MGELAQELIADNPGNVCPRSLLNFNDQHDKALDVETIRTLREECGAVEDFLLKGEFTEREQVCIELYSGPVRGEFGYEERTCEDRTVTEIKARSAKRPASFTTGDFLRWADEKCRFRLETLLKDFCLNPEQEIGDPPYFQNIIHALTASAEKWAQNHREGVAETSVSRALAEAVEYARATGSVVLFSGENSIGKSFQARALCEQRPGVARFWSVAAGNDRRSFFKGGVDAYGGPAGHAYKALELQQRLEEILAHSGTVTVFDSALQLLPDREREATPDRVDWIVTALAERGLPAVILADASFDVRLLAIQERSRWSMRAFDERVFRWPVPQLTREDIQATAAAMFPCAGPKGLAALVHVTATAGAGSLGFLEKTRRSASFNAGKDSMKADHIRQALSGHVIPHMQRHAEAKAHAQKKAARKFTRTPAPATAPRIARESVAATPRSLRDTRAAEMEAPAREVAPEGFVAVPAE